MTTRFPLVEHELLTAPCDPATLPDLLALHHRLTSEFHAMSVDTGTLFGVDDDTLALARDAAHAAWSISLCCPGSTFGSTEPPDLSRYNHCSATVLARHTPDRQRDLQYRGACLGCGWVSGLAVSHENAAVELAHDHTHPGWRDLPIIPASPTGQDGGPPRASQLDAWLAKVTPLLPDGWLARGGPIRTHRNAPGNRHVGERAHGGGYDLAHTFATERPLEAH